MQKSLLALAVAAVAASSVASAATVYDKDGTSLDMYGRVQGVAYSQDYLNTSASGDAGLVGSGRLGFDLRTPLTENIAAFANAEWDVSDSDTTESFSSRYLWVGADFGQYGQLKAGRFEDAVYNGVTAMTDILEDSGCVGQLGDGDKRDGMFMYTWSGYGVDFMATYGTAKDGQSVDGAWYADQELDIKNSYSVALGYTTPDILFAPISVKAGWGYAQFQDDKATATTTNRLYDNYSHWAAGLSWGAEVGPFVAATYNKRDFHMNADSGFDNYTVQGVEALVGYAFENGVSVTTGYEWLNHDGNKQDVDAKVIPVYVNYNVTPNFNVWGEARFDADSDKEIAELSGDPSLDENVYSVGARYTF